MKGVEIGLPICVSFHLAKSKPSPSTSGTHPNQRDGLRQVVATVYPGDGGEIDGSRLDAARGLALSRATVATATDGLTHGAG